jgi:hypothetical protein
MPGGDVGHLAQEIAQVRKRFGLSDEAPVLSCDEAGHDGFWLHRCPLAQDVANVVVDSSSLEVNRRQRRAKNDRLDAGRLLAMRIRHAAGERALWSVVNVASLQPILWTSIATGKRADKHGILGFAELDGTTGKIRPVTSTSRKCKAIWNILSDNGLKAGVVNWSASRPAVRSSELRQQPALSPCQRSRCRLCLRAPPAGPPSATPISTRQPFA